VLGAYVASLMVFSVTTRYRMPAVPVLLVFAGHALAFLSEGEFARVKIKALAGIAALLLLLNVPLGASRSLAMSYNNYGNMFGREGRPGKALEMYRKGLEHAPRDPLLLFNTAVALEHKGGMSEKRQCMT
ncbi:hypothetical protein ACFL2T_07735, partial [Elusimicrobiota bacterium]